MSSRKRKANQVETEEYVEKEWSAHFPYEPTLTILDTEKECSDFVKNYLKKHEIIRFQEVDFKSAAKFKINRSPSFVFSKEGKEIWRLTGSDIAQENLDMHMYKII